MFGTLLLEASAGVAKFNQSQSGADAFSDTLLLGEGVSFPSQVGLAPANWLQANSPFTDFYYRIWSSPRQYKIEGVRIGIEYSIGVWNAFDVANNLESLSGVPQGVEFLDLPPLEFSPNQFRKLEFAVDATADFNTSAEIQFQFEIGYGFFGLEFTTAQIFRILPDEGVEEVWIWNTSIQTSASGKERRAQLRFHPRIQQAYKMTIDDDQKRSAQFKNIWSHLSEPATFPMLQYAAQIQQAEGAGGIELRFDNSLAMLTAGAPAILYTPLDDSMVLVAIDELTPTGATLVNPLSVNVSEAWTISPALKMRLPDDSSLSMSHVNGAISINTESMAPRLIQVVNYPIPQMDGLPLIPFPPLGIESIPEKFNQQIDTLDNNIRAPEIHTLQEVPVVKSLRNFVVERDSSDFHFWPTFGNLVRGSLKPFLASSGRHDFSLAAPVDEGDAFLIVHDNGFGDIFSEAFSRIQITDGTNAITRTITGVEKDGGMLRLILGEAVDLELAFNRVSLLHKVRIDGDAISLTHYRNYTLVRLQVRTVLE